MSQVTARHSIPPIAAWRSRIHIASCASGLLACMFPSSVEGQAPREFHLAAVATVAAPTLINPTGITIGTDQRVYVVDQAPARIRVYDPQGKYLRDIGREGDGPGEYRAPIVAVDRQVVVHDPRSRRLTQFTLDGQVVWTKPGPCCVSHPLRLSTDGRIFAFASPVVIGGGPAWDQIVVFRSDGTPIDTLPVVGRFPDPTALWTVMTKQAALSAPIPFRARPHFVVTRSGTILTSSASGYVLVEGHGGKDTMRIIRPQWTPFQLAASVRHAALAGVVAEFLQFSDSVALQRVFKLADVPSQAPAVFGLDVDACGRWWVQRTTGSMGAPTRFDLFSPIGVFQGTVSVPQAILEPGRWAVGQESLAMIGEASDGSPVLSVFSTAILGSCRP